MNDPAPLSRTIATLAGTARSNATTLVIACMAIIACLGYSGVFARWTYLVPVVIAVFGATTVSVVARHKKWLVGEALFVSTASFFVVGIVATQWFPGFSSPGDFAAALANGWADLLSSQPPADLRPSLAVVPFATAWVTTTIAQELDRRAPYFGVALVGVLVGLVGTSLFSIEVRTMAKVQGPLLIGLTLILALIQRHARERSSGALVSQTSGTGTAGLVRAGAMLVTIGIVAATIGPRLPLANNRDRFNLRDLQDHPWDPLVEPSPLVTLKANLKEGARDDVLFRVTSADPVVRFTRAVMTSYDGIVWQVADPAGDAPAQFVPVDSELPKLEGMASTLDTRSFDLQFEIVGLTGPWVPHGGIPLAVRFGEDRDLRLNLNTGTLAVPVGLAPGDTFSVTTSMPPELPEPGLSQAVFDLDSDETTLDLVPAPILNLAAELVEGVDMGGLQVLAIQNLLVNDGFYDAGRSRPPGHSYAQIATFLDDPTRVVGYEEQYAAAAAVLARAAGIPTRVVTGFKIETGRYQGGVAEITGNDTAAWIEVLVKGVGWVPVDVTPERTRQPTDQNIGRVTRNVAIPNDPPPPPPPLDSRPVDPPDEEEEEEVDEDEDEVVEARRSLVDILLDRPGLIAGSVALSPFILFALLGLLAAALKLRRRRKRRNAETTSLQISGAWAEMVDRFQEVGHPIPRNAAPLEIAEGLLHDQAVNSAEPEIRELVSLVSRSAFASSPPSAADVDEAWRCANVAGHVATSDLDLAERIKVHVDPRPLMRPNPTGARK